MQVTLPQEQTQEIQQMIATLIKDEIHHFMGLPYIRIGKSIRFNKESINQWMTRLEISA